MSLPQVNLLNIGLMLASVAAAFALPFEVFLFSYAVLGPLHYLTELSWLHDRKYFTSSKLDAIPLAALCLLVALGAGLTQTAYVAGLRPWSTEITFLAFGGALVLVLIRDARVRTAAVIALVVVALVLRELGFGPSTPSAYRVFFTVYLATVVHVFVFTGAFILLGALRSNSRSGLVSFGVFLACAVACFVIRKDLGYVASRTTAESYYLFGASVNRHLVEDLHLGRVTTVADIYTAPASIAVTRFIAYAYTYHYLNWFSKTSVIRWHEVPKSRFVAVGAIWIASLALYATNYRNGIQWLFFLSLLHVFLEFPLNHRSFMELGGELRKRVWTSATAG